MKKTVILIAMMASFVFAVNCPIPPGLDPNDYGIEPGNYPISDVFSIKEGTIITKTLKACDPDGDRMKYRLIAGPTTMTLTQQDPNEAVLSWVAERGVWYVDVQVYDEPPEPNDTLSDYGTIVFKVRRDNKPPVFGGCR